MGAVLKDVFPVPLPDKLPLGWKREKNELMESMGANPSECPVFRRDDLWVTITFQREQDGKRWFHVSISRRDRLPSYFDLCDVKTAFLGEDALALLLFVPKVEHVNIHPNCLHLWSCADGRPTPDFTWGMNSI